jgi:hypothetical protein
MCPCYSQQLLRLLTTTKQHQGPAAYIHTSEHPTAKPPPSITASLHAAFDAPNRSHLAQVSQTLLNNKFTYRHSLTVSSLTVLPVCLWFVCVPLQNMETSTTVCAWQMEELFLEADDGSGRAGALLPPNTKRMHACASLTVNSNSTQTPDHDPPLLSKPSPEILESQGSLTNNDKVVHVNCKGAVRTAAPQGISRWGDVHNCSTRTAAARRCKCVQPATAAKVTASTADLQSSTPLRVMVSRWLAADKLQS